MMLQKKTRKQEEVLLWSAQPAWDSCIHCRQLTPLYSATNSANNVPLQALHALCLAHFERDQAAGGDMYARFAACYLNLAGQHQQHQPHKLAQDMKKNAGLGLDEPLSHEVQLVLTYTKYAMYPCHFVVFMHLT